MNEQQFQKVAKKTIEIKLSPEVKTRQLSTLRAFMAANPIAPRLTKSSWMYRLGTREWVSIGLSGALAFGGATSAFASQALPGDFLYPVKINLNEKVEAAFAVTPEAKAAVEAKQASRRLEEAEQLAAAGRLDEVRRVEIAAEFNLRAEKVHARVERLQEKGDLVAAAAVSADFEARLGEHEEKLAIVVPVSATATLEAPETVGVVHPSATVRVMTKDSMKNFSTAAAPALVQPIKSDIVDFIAHHREEARRLRADIEVELRTGDSPRKHGVVDPTVPTTTPQEKKENVPQRQPQSARPLPPIRAEMKSEIKARILDQAGEIAPIELDGAVRERIHLGI